MTSKKEESMGEDWTDLTFKEVWDRLSTIDVSEHVKKKNKMSYLSWPWAWATLMDHYPESTYEFKIPGSGYSSPDGVGYHNDGSASVYCSITIHGLTRDMFLPVMTGFTNSPVEHPTSRDIGDAKMRCLVKCLGMFGLGHYLYAGEDLPRDAEPKATGKVLPKVADASKEADVDAKLSASALTLTTFIEDETDLDSLRDFWKKNKKPLKELEAGNKEMYERVLATFKEKGKEIADHKKED
jgi:hypothetical protein